MTTNVLALLDDMTASERQSIDAHNLVLARIIAVKVLREEGFSLRLIADVMGLSVGYIHKFSMFTLQ